MTTPAAPGHTAPAADLVRFDGIGNVRIGETISDLTRDGYTGAPGSFGCSQYHSAATGLYVTVSTARKVVLAVDALANPKYATATGIKVGSGLASVRKAYRGSKIENHLDGSFGQGSDGVLIAGPGGWIGFAISAGRVAGLKAGVHDHAGALEASC